MPGVVAITGAAGFLGSRLVPGLLADGHAVRALIRTTPVPGAVNLTMATTPEGLAAQLEGVDTVLHLVAMYVRDHRPADVAGLVEAQVGLGARLLDAMRLAGVRRLVVTDSWFAHRGPDGAGALDLYAATRQAFDAIVRWYEEAHGLLATRLVLYDTYGPDDPRRRLVPALLRARETGAPLPLVDGGDLLDLVHVDDVARAYRRAVQLLAEAPEQVAGRAWAVRSGVARTAVELCRLLERVGGKEIPHQLGGWPAPERTMGAPWPGPWLPGWRPEITLEDGLRALCAAVAGVAGE
jgi:nucleoside-diphosphate-sugar epimerase